MTGLSLERSNLPCNRTLNNDSRPLFSDSTYRLRVNDVLARSHRDAYHTAVYLLRRAANEPLQTVAIRFGISPSRISKIQQAIEAALLTPQQVRVFAKCKVKN